MTRRRVLFFAEAVTLAHVARATVLARSLNPAEYEVHAAWDPRFNHLLGDLPFVVHPIHSLSSDVFLGRLRRGAPMHDVETLRQYVSEDLAVIERVAPNLVVGDFRLSLAASARVAGVRHVAVANAYWSPHRHHRFLFPEYEYPLSSLVGNRVARKAFQLLRPVGFAAHTHPLNRVLREHGLPSIGRDIRTMYTFGDYTAYADIPGLIPLEDVPATHRFIGAVLWSPAAPFPDWWTMLPTDRPIVYVTPGSSGEADFLPVALRALSELPLTVMAATAGRVKLDQVPPGARVADFLPGIAAARRASLVICNGGSPTAYQALAAGTPVIGLVSNNMDQHLNMEALCAAGAGEVLRARGLTVSRLRDAVQRMLETPAYRVAASQLAATHLRCDPTDRFPEMISTLPRT